MLLELHCHSTCSDGAEPAVEVARRALARELVLFCLTDHDTCAGSETVAAEVGPRAMRAVEVSCTEDGKTVHILCYDTGAGDWAPVQELLTQQAIARVNRVRVIGSQLRLRFGLDVDVTPILAEAERRSVGRPDVAALLVAQGHAKHRDDAFDRFLYDGGPGDPPHRRLPIAELLERVTAAGGRAALAHPHLYGDRGITWLRRHRDAGLGGVEAFYGHYDPGQQARWLSVADKLQLVPCGGSDWHGPGTARDVGIDIPAPHAERILTWLGRA
jgi:predicted metal-dependent phosphoesterase TrpH